MYSIEHVTVHPTHESEVNTVRMGIQLMLFIHDAYLMVVVILRRRFIFWRWGYARLARLGRDECCSSIIAGAVANDDFCMFLFSSLHDSRSTTSSAATATSLKKK